MVIREKIWRLLCNVAIDKKYANLLLRNELKDWDQKDKAFITQIVYGTLQNARLVRYEWEDFVKLKPSEEICLLLDMSVYQLLFMDRIAEYAIVNEAVDIAKKRNKGNYQKLVNAVLHKVIKRGKREIIGTPFEVLSITYSLPLWLIKMWNAQYGSEICDKLCKDNLTIGNTWVRFDDRFHDVKSFLKEHQDYEASGINETCLIYKGKQLIESEAYQSGLISIQDASSQMIALELDPKEKDRVLDCCGAPGSKSCHIASLMKDQGVVISGDIHEHRVTLIRQGAQRCGLKSIEAKLLDARCLDEYFEKASFDCVLADVPCSGYGVLKGKSDIKYHMQGSDMDHLLPLQKEILNSAATMVKQNGTLVYSTCTLNKKENEKQIETFLETHLDYDLVKQATIFPFTYGSDGFYFAKLKKK
ncbi:MAG: 16S rRNA (cytosine(967)-C(5))-methyltransferase RsmB [Erysipelotrichaceae bacterium]